MQNIGTKELDFANHLELVASKWYALGRYCTVSIQGSPRLPSVEIVSSTPTLPTISKCPEPPFISAASIDLIYNGSFFLKYTVL